MKQHIFTICILILWILFILFGPRFSVDVVMYMIAGWTVGTWIPKISEHIFPD